jgi:hypothetical protein
MLSLLIALLVGSSSPSQDKKFFTPVDVVFDEREVEWFKTPGSATLSGSALLRTVGGQVRTCAGLEVNLVPASTYAAVRMRTMFGSVGQGFMAARGARKWAATDQNYVRNLKQTVCDPQGYFSFENLPDGDYFVTAFVSWSVPTRYFNRLEGGVLMKAVRIENGRAEKVVLTA